MSNIKNHSIECVDLSELETLAQNGGADPEGRISPTVTASSIPCIGATAAGVTAVGDFFSNLLSCTHFC